MDIKELCQHILNEERKQKEQHQMEQAMTLLKKARHEPQPIQHVGFKRLICQLFVQNTIVLAIHRLWNIQDNTPLCCTNLYNIIIQILNSPDARSYVQIQRSQGIPIEAAACQYIDDQKPVLSSYCSLLAHNMGCDQTVGQFFDTMQKIFINNRSNLNIIRYETNIVILKWGNIIADQNCKIIEVLHQVLRQMPLGFFANINQFDPFFPYIIEHYSRKNISFAGKVDREITLYIKFYILRRVSYYSKKDIIDFPMFFAEIWKQTSITDGSGVCQLTQYVEN